DDAPIAAPGDAWARLQPAIATAQVSAALEVESSYSQPDAVFSGTHSAVVLSSSHGWNAEQMMKLIADGINAQASTAHLGARWTLDGNFQRLDGLLPLFFAVRGNTLILANDSDLLKALSAKPGTTPAAGGSEIFAAGFRHAQEASAFAHTSTLIDRANMRGSQDGSTDAGRTPAFFSGNLASFSRVFSGVVAESIVERRSGDNVTQTVTYQW